MKFFPFFSFAAFLPPANLEGEFILLYVTAGRQKCSQASMAPVLSRSINNSF